MKQFLQKISEQFEIFIYTSSLDSYAEAVMAMLDPDRQLIEHIFSRDSCFVGKDGSYQKDLRIINRDPKDIVLIDNSAQSLTDHNVHFRLIQREHSLILD